MIVLVLELILFIVHADDPGTLSYHQAGLFSSGRAYLADNKLAEDEETWLRLIRQPGPFNNATSVESVDFSSGGSTTKARTWKRSHLALGHLASNHTQFKALFDKLRHGDALHVLAYGSSITQDQGGCFHTGPTQTLAARIGADRMQDVNMIYRSQGDRHGKECDFPIPTWGNMFMQVINSTWPHPGHTFINSGIAACGVECPFEKGCVESTLPSRLDLIIMEAFRPLHAEKLEQILWRLFDYYLKQGQPRPAVVYLQSGFVADPDTSADATTCMRDASKCETLCSNDQVFGPDIVGETSKAHVSSSTYDTGAVNLAQHYGFTVISHRHFLSTMLRQGVPAQMLEERTAQDPTWASMSTCRFLSAIHADAIHLDPIGRLLYADYLLDVLTSAQSFLGSAEGSRAEMPAIPRDPLFPKGRELVTLQCMVMRDARQVRYSMNPGMPIVMVTQADGWEFSEYQIHGSHKKYKPGWIATRPGSKMILELNTQFSVKDLEGPTTVAVMYLESYEHMGAARARCVKGCSCQPVTVHAHAPAQHASVANTFELVTQPPVPVCAIEIEVLPETRSGEHKFKVLSITAKKADQVWQV